MKTVALYLHMPFCARKCAYCDFASYPGRERDMARYFASVEREMDEQCARFGAMRAKTVFVGGGTPSLMSGDQAAALMKAVRARFEIEEDAEITLEANPGTLDREKLSAYRAAGFNRISLGAQAAQSGLLKTLGRIHQWEDVARSVKMARSCGFHNLNIDLMYALPGQSERDWTETLERAMALSPEHLSCYSLIVEEGTPLKERLERGEISLPGEEAALAFQTMVERILPRAGYERYEISNYARKGYECRHNLAYWMRDDYLGLGCAAHSLMNGLRFGNTPDLDEYLSGRYGREEEALAPLDERVEAVMLGLRLTNGLNGAEYLARYGRDLLKEAPRAFEKLGGLGLLKWDGEKLCLTPDGLRVQNAALVEILEEMEGE